MVKKVLILCTGNSCRSIMAEALINALGAGSYQAHSAGSAPTGIVHPQALATLRNHHIPFDQVRSKSWDEFSDVAFDLIITVCDQAAQESCPVRVGAHQRMHWSIPDPARVDGTPAEVIQAFEQAYEMLRTHIENELLSAFKQG
ncbi:MAG: arsenate reductase ArsC [bacterium]